MKDGTDTAGFHSLYHHGFARVAACTLPVALADPMENARHTLQAIRACHEAGAVLSVFPELGLSGYAIDDLRQQDVLLDGVHEAIGWLAGQTAGLLPLVLVGAPLAVGDALYNCAVALHDGRVVGVVPKSYLPDYREFYEARQFTPGAGLRGGMVTLGGEAVPFGTDLLFHAPAVQGLVVAAEICEDMWVPHPPGARACPKE